MIGMQVEYHLLWMQQHFAETAWQAGATQSCELHLNPPLRAQMVQVRIAIQPLLALQNAYNTLQ